jgi:hypothetical protein
VVRNFDHRSPGGVEELDGAGSHRTEVNPRTRFQHLRLEKNGPLV